MKARRWTQAEIDYIRANYGKIARTEIAAHIGVSPRLISDCAKRHGVYVPKYASWTGADLAKLRAEFPTANLRKLAADMNRSVIAIKNKAIQIGLTRKPRFTDEQIQNFKDLYPITKNTELMRLFGFRNPQAVSHYAQVLGVRKAENYWREIIRDDISRAIIASYADPDVAEARRKGQFRPGHKFGHRFKRGDKFSKEVLERRMAARAATVKAERRRIMFGLEQKTKLRLKP